MAIELVGGAFFSRLHDILCNWLDFRKLLNFLQVKKVTKLLGKLKIWLRSANKPLKDAAEEQGISVSRTSEGSSEHGEFEHRQQKLLEEIEFMLHRNFYERVSGLVVAEGPSASRSDPVNRVASCQMQLLIESDYPPNIIRFHGVVKCDEDFINLAKERRRFMSLDDLVLIRMNNTRMTAQPNDRLESLKKILENVELVAENGHPSPLLLKLFREILFGVSHLHDKLQIVHGRLNPESILIGLEGSFSELGKGQRGCVNSDWRACIEPTWEEDMHALGGIFYYCITGRPFGEGKTVEKKQWGLEGVECPEALHFISHLLNPNPKARPKAIKLLQHPLFWNPEKRLSFLCDTSERVGDPRYSKLSKELRKIAVPKVTSIGESWEEQIDDDIVTHMNKRWKQEKMYDYCSVQDLVRFIRNMKVHYRQLPRQIQLSVGTLHKGLDSYFTSRFPKLLMEVYKVVCRCYQKDEYFCRYFKGDVIF